MTERRGVPPISLIALAVAAVCHAVAYGYYRAYRFEGVPFFGFEGVAAFLIAASMAAHAFMLGTRRRWLMYVAASVAVAALFALVASGGPALVAELLLVVALVVHLSIYEGFPLNLVACSAVTVACAGWRIFAHPQGVALPPEHGAESLLLALVGIVTAGLGAALTVYRERSVSYAADLQRLDVAVAEMIKAQSGYLQYADAASNTSMMEERNRITRDLHDTIGYSLTNVIMVLEASKDAAGDSPSRLSELLQTAREQVEHCLMESRRTLHLLRDQEDRRPKGIVAIQKLVSTFKAATGIDVEVEYSNVPLSLGEEIDSALYYFVQEGLTNSFRHGHATRVRIVFWKDERMLRVSMRDNGTGAAHITEGIGMHGMRERLGMLGGLFTARNAADGFEIVADFPFGE